MTLVEDFCFRHQLLGQNTKSPADVAIKVSDGTVAGQAGSCAACGSRPSTCRWRRKGSYDGAGMHAGAQRPTLWGVSRGSFSDGRGALFYASHQRHAEEPGRQGRADTAALAKAFAEARAATGSGSGADARFFQDERHAAFLHGMFGPLRWRAASASFMPWRLLVPAVFAGCIWRVPLLRRRSFCVSFCSRTKSCLSVLRILFIAFGIDELSKLMLIRDRRRADDHSGHVHLGKSVPKEQIVKGFTLGAGDFSVAYSWC